MTDQEKSKENYPFDTSKMEVQMMHNNEQVKSFSYPLMIHHTLDLKKRISHTAVKMDLASEQYFQMMEFRNAIMAAYNELNFLD